MPLPREIAKVQYEERFSTFSDTDKEIAQKWYILDLNTDFYRLVHLKDKDDPAFWVEARPVLLKALDGVEFSPSLFVGGSITEWEAQFAMSSPDIARALWAHRKFTNPERAYPVYPGDKHKELRDEQGNKNAETRLSRLKESMKIKLPPENVHEQSISVEAYKGEGFWSLFAENIDYFAEFEEYYRELFKSEVEALIERTKKWNQDGNGIGLSGEDIDEILHHYTWAREKCDGFYGRYALIEQCLSMIDLRKPCLSKLFRGILIQ